MTTNQGGRGAIEDLISSLRPTLSPNVDEWIEDSVTWVLRDGHYGQSLYVVAATEGEYDVTVGEGVHAVWGLTRPELEPLLSLLGKEMLFSAKSSTPLRRPYLSLSDGTPVLAREAGALGRGRARSLVPVPSKVDHIATLRSELAPLLRSSVTEFAEHDRWHLAGRRCRQKLSIGYEGGSTISIELGESFVEMVDFPKKDLPGVLERFDTAELSWTRFSVMGIPVSEGVIFADGHRAPSNRFHGALSRIAKEKRLVAPRSDVRPE